MKTNRLIISVGFLIICVSLSSQSEKKPITQVMHRIISEQDVQSAIKYYREVREDPSGGCQFDELQLNSLGFRLIREDRLAEAVEIFKLNV